MIIYWLKGKRRFRTARASSTLIHFIATLCKTATRNYKILGWKRIAYNKNRRFIYCMFISKPFGKNPVVGYFAQVI